MQMYRSGTIQQDTSKCDKINAKSVPECEGKDGSGSVGTSYPDAMCRLSVQAIS
ncbi:hypothetical protein OAV68_00460 [bacterium]|nr:hypothetical protein [bacterium]